MAFSIPAAVCMNARRRMTGHRFQRNALGDERADPLQRDDLFKFDAVAKGAARGDDRVAQLDPANCTLMSGFTRGRFPRILNVYWIAGGSHTFMILAAHGQPFRQSRWSPSKLNGGMSNDSQNIDLLVT